MAEAVFQCFFSGYSTTFRQNRQPFSGKPGDPAGTNTARLEHALPDSRLKERMQTEPDFLPYLTTPAFQALTEGKDYE